MYLNQQCLPRQFYTEQCKKGEEEEEKKNWESNISDWMELRVATPEQNVKTRSDGAERVARFVKS